MAEARQQRWCAKDDKQLAGTGGRVNGHVSRENHRQQYRENRSDHVATIGVLLLVRGSTIMATTMTDVMMMNSP